MASYATRAELKAYSVLPQVDSATDAALDEALEQATRDVDRLLGPLALQANGLKYGDLLLNPLQITALRVSTLRNATCAQAEYRLVQCPEFFVTPQPETTSGPDFTVKQAKPRFGPKAREELYSSGLAALTWTRTSV